MEELVHNDARLLESLLDVKLPETYRQFLQTLGSAFIDGYPILGLPLSPSLDSVWGATNALWSLRPDLEGRILTIQLRQNSFIGIDLRGTDQSDPPVIAVATEGAADVRIISPTLTQFLLTASTSLNPLDQIAQVWNRTPVAARPELLAQSFNLDFPERLSNVLQQPLPTVLDNVVYQVEGDFNKSPNILWAISMMREGAQKPPTELVPIAAVDERSFACVVCKRKGAPPSPKFGHIVRWHLDPVPARAQHRLLDTDIISYLNTVAADLNAREAGLARIREVAEAYEQSHGTTEKLPKAHEERPIRLAVQNVIVGLAAFHHESSFDGLSVSAWQSCQVPHVNVHEGCRGLAAMTLSEAFRSGGTMEIRFDRHPERRVPAILRQYARTQGLTIGVEDSKAVSPTEARALYLAVTQMPTDLRTRVERLVATGILSAERVCFILMSGIWKPIELDFILATSKRSESVLRGSTPPFQRSIRQAEFGVMRAALMLGMFFNRLRHGTTSDDVVAQVLEDERQGVQWQVLGDEGAVHFTHISTGLVPWLYGTEFELSDNKSLIVFAAHCRYDRRPTVCRCTWTAVWNTCGDSSSDWHHNR